MKLSYLSIVQTTRYLSKMLKRAGINVNNLKQNIFTVYAQMERHLLSGPYLTNLTSLTTFEDFA